MRVLEFPSVEVYDIFFESLLSLTTKGEDTKKIGKVVKSLKKVGTPKIVNGEPHKRLMTLAENRPVEIEDDRFDAVKRLMQTVEYTGVGVELAGEMLDWLDEVPTKEKWEARQEARKDGILKLESKGSDDRASGV